MYFIIILFWVFSHSYLSNANAFKMLNKFFNYINNKSSKNLDASPQHINHESDKLIYDQNCENECDNESLFISADEEHFNHLENNIAFSKDVENINCAVTRSPRKSILALFDPLFPSSPIVNQNLINNDIIYEDDFNINELLVEDVEHLDEFVEGILDDIISRVVIQPLAPLDIIPDILRNNEMENLNETMVINEDESEDTKLQLKQVRASLELQLRQKDEIIVKTQAELARQEQLYKKELNALKEKMEENPSEVDNSQVKELHATIKQLKAQIASDNNIHKEEANNYKKIFEGFENTMAKRLSEWNTLNNEHEAVKRHLANLELAFSDVHQKYERCKKIIEGYKNNEDTLRENLITAQENLVKSEEKYESLKAHAKAQIEKCNQEIQMLREEYEGEITKLNGVNKRLKIKNESLSSLLEQKTKECSALAAFCDEVTGKI